MLATSSQILTSATGLILVTALLISAYTDLRWRIIPNWVTYPAILIGLLLNLVHSMSGGKWSELLGTVGFADSLLGCFMLFFGLLVIFSFSGGGAGDVKLVGAIGALLGFVNGAEAVCLSFIVCAAIVLCGSLMQMGPFRILGAMFRRVGNYMFFEYVKAPEEDQNQLLQSTVPLAPFFGLGVLLVLLRDLFVENPEPFQFLIF